MLPKKTLPEREKELQALLATAAGRQELQALQSRYHQDYGGHLPAAASVITYILVYERNKGLIGG